MAEVASGFFCTNMEVLVCEGSLQFLWVQLVSNLSELLRALGRYSELQSFQEVAHVEEATVEEHVGYERGNVG